MSQNPPRLIVNADDFGLHSSINSAIIEAHTLGIVNSASLMAIPEADSFYEAVRLAKAHPALQVGLHFALVGLPRLPKKYPQFVLEYLQGRFPPSRIETLLNRQLDLLDQNRIHPTHIDSHQHIHALPSVMRIVCKVARERGIERIRLPLETSPSSASITRIASSHALSALARLSKRELVQSGAMFPDQFFGMAVSGHLTEDRLLGMIAELPSDGVSEIICHPGGDNSVLERELGWGYDWEGELWALCSDSVIKRTEQFVLKTIETN